MSITTETKKLTINLANTAKIQSVPNQKLIIDVKPVVTAAVFGVIDGGTF